MVSAASHHGYAAPPGPVPPGVRRGAARHAMPQLRGHLPRVAQLRVELAMGNAHGSKLTGVSWLSWLSWWDGHGMSWLSWLKMVKPARKMVKN